MTPREQAQLRIQMLSEEPGISQRQLPCAWASGLGKTNYLLKALLEGAD